ncbi:MAG: hypothetical protein CMK07_07170 [Ponticaulis sp.]|nr:hypothetical protein [Ponticaulis sp.]
MKRLIVPMIMFGVVGTIMTLVFFQSHLTLNRLETSGVTVVADVVDIERRRKRKAYRKVQKYKYYADLEWFSSEGERNFRSDVRISPDTALGRLKSGRQIKIRYLPGHRRDPVPVAELSDKKRDSLVWTFISAICALTGFVVGGLAFFRTRRG